MISGSTTLHKVPFLHKIDMYGSFFLLWMIWEVPYMAGSFTNEHAIIYVPYEMLIHGPVILDPMVDISSSHRLRCNRHFQLFLNSPAYLTDDFMSAVLTKAKSEEFLMQADVANTLGILRNNTNATLVHLGLYLHKVCELTLPRFKEGGCLSYQRVYETCLSSNCGDKVFLCWWQHLGIIQVILSAHVFLFMPGVFVLILTMFDPPPLGFRIFAKPWIVGVSFCSSSAMAFLYLSLTIASVRNYLDQQIFFDTYSNPDSAYAYFYGQGFIFTTIGAAVNLIFGLCYFYLACFTPAYPRHESRHQHRRGYFFKQLVELQAEVGLPTVTSLESYDSIEGKDLQLPYDYEEKQL